MDTPEKSELDSESVIINDTDENTVPSLSEDASYESITALEECYEETPLDEKDLEDLGFSEATVSAPNSNESFVQETRQRTTGFYTRQERTDARQEHKSSLGVYVTALKNKTILQAVVAGVDEDRNTAYWICWHNDIVIKIPFKNSFMRVPADLLDSNDHLSINRQRQLLSSAIGATIVFTVSSISTDDDAVEVIASRTQALANIRRRYWGPNATSPLSQGDTVRLQVLTTGRSTAYVTGYGMDFRVENHRLSHQYMESVSDVFSPGDYVKMRIQYIGDTTDAVAKPPAVSVSARDVEMEDFRKITKHLKRNSRWGATVCSIQTRNTEDGIPKITVALWLHGIGVPAFSSYLVLRMREQLHTGDKIMFEVTGINDHGYPHGRIVRYCKHR